MAEAGKVPAKIEKVPAHEPQAWQPLQSLRREIDRIFDEFDRGFWRAPLHRPDVTFIAAPAVDVAETDKAYEITAELPGMDEKNVEVNVANGVLTIKGEKQEEKEEKKKDYYMRERSYGSFQRSFAVPEGVDADKVEATFKKGVLTVTLPKTAGAQKAEKKITVKPA